MSATNYFKAGRAIVPFEESSTGAVRLAYAMAASLARRLRASVSVCYPVPLPGKWATVPAILTREKPVVRMPPVRHRETQPLAFVPFGEAGCF